MSYVIVFLQQSLNEAELKEYSLMKSKEDKMTSEASSGSSEDSEEDSEDSSDEKVSFNFSWQHGVIIWGLSRR